MEIFVGDVWKNVHTGRRVKIEGIEVISGYSVVISVEVDSGKSGRMQTSEFKKHHNKE